MSAAPGMAFMYARALHLRAAKEEGAGALSQVPFKGAGFYESTGSQVAVRSAPMVTAPWEKNVLGTLEIGDVVKASGSVQQSGGIDFAQVDSAYGPGWVATMYLQPSQKTKLSGSAPLQGPPANPSPAPSDDFAESGIVSGWGLAGALILIAVGIYFVAK